MTLVYQILFTCLIASPFLLIGAMIEMAASDSTLIAGVLGLVIIAIVICGAIVGFDFITVIWS